MAEELRRYASKRQIINYNDVINKSGEATIICVDKGVLSIIVKLLSTRGLWRSTYAVANYNGVYSIPSREQFDVIDGLVGSFIAEIGQMTTCNELQASLEALTNVLSGGLGSNNCGCGTSGATGQAPSDVEPGPPGEQIGDPPPGFSTWAEYETYKCDMAQKIYDTLYADMEGLSTYTLISISTAGFLAGIATPILGANILAIVGIALALASQGVYLAVLEGIIDALDEAETDLICAMFEAGSQEEAETNVKAILGDAIDVELATPLNLSGKQLVDYWVTPDSLNPLFDRDPVAIAKGLPIGDCSGCDDCPEDVWMIAGTFDGVDEFTSEEFTDATYAKERIVVRFEADNEGGYCGDVTINDVTLDSGTIYAPPVGGPTKRWNLYDVNGSKFYDSDTEPTWPVNNVARLDITSTRYLANPPGEFIVTIDWTPA